MPLGAAAAAANARLAVVFLRLPWRVSREQRLLMSSLRDGNTGRARSVRCYSPALWCQRRRRLWRRFSTQSEHPRRPLSPFRTITRISGSFCRKNVSPLYVGDLAQGINSQLFLYMACDWGLKTLGVAYIKILFIMKWERPPDYAYFLTYCLRCVVVIYLFHNQQAKRTVNNQVVKSVLCIDIYLLIFLRH